MAKSSASTLPAHLAMIAVSLFYGINYFTLKFAFADGIHPWALLAMRGIFTLLLFPLFHFLFIKEKIKDKKDLLRLALCALFGISINQFFFLWGMDHTSSLNAAVLMITTPVFVFGIGALLKTEQINFRKIAGLAVSFLGAFFLIQESAGKNISFSNEGLLGDMMIIINAASYGTYLVLVRPLILKYNPFTIMKWVFIFGALINIPLGATELAQSDFGALSSLGWLGLLWLLVAATALAYFGNAWAMKRVPSSAVGMYIFVQPIFVTLISALFVSGSVTLSKVGFILMIIGGVYLVTMRKAPPPAAPAEP